MEKQKKKKSWCRTLGKIILVIFLCFVLLVIVTGTYFRINRPPRPQFHCSFAESYNNEVVAKKLATQECTNKPLIDVDGVCYSCDELFGVTVRDVEENCRVCDNRKVVDGECILKKCPETHPIRDYFNGCHSCNERSVIVSKAMDCLNVCDGKRTVIRKSFDLQCVLPCSEDKPLMDVLGDCHSCDEKDSICVGYDRKSCQEICPNRVLEGDDKIFCRLPCAENEIVTKENRCCSCDTPRVLYDMACFELCRDKRMIKENSYPQQHILKECPPEYPLRADNGACYSCNDVNSFEMKEHGEDCSGICGLERTFLDNRCVLSMCTEDYPMHDTWGKCHACDDPDNIITFEDECLEMCGDKREMRDVKYRTGDCVLKTCPATHPLRAPSGKCVACEDVGLEQFGDEYGRLCR